MPKSEVGTWSSLLERFDCFVHRRYESNTSFVNQRAPSIFFLAGGGFRLPDHFRATLRGTVQLPLCANPRNAPAKSHRISFARLSYTLTDVARVAL